MGLYAKVLGWVLDHHRLTLRVGAGLLLLVLLAQPPLKIYIELDSMLPDDSEITRSIKDAQRLFGPTDYVVVGLTHRDGLALDEAGARQLARVHATLAAQPGVRPADVISLIAERARVVEPGDDLRIERILRDAGDWNGASGRAQRSSVYRSLLSPDGKSTLLLFRIREPAEGKHAYLTRLRQELEAVRDPAFTLFVGGQPAVLAAMERYSQHVFLVLPLALLLIGLIHFEAFRSLQGLLFPLVTAVVSAQVSSAAVHLAGVRIDAFNGTAPLLIVALTAGHAVQMLKRYNEELAAQVRGLAPGTPGWLAANRRAIEQAFLGIAPVMAAASLVAAASLASLMVFKTPVIRTFGAQAAVGILCGLVVELVFIPALRLRYPPKQPPHSESRVTVWDRIVARCAALSAPGRRRRTVMFGGALFSVCAVLAAQVRVDNSVEEFFAGFTEIRQSERALNERYSGSNVLYVMLEGEAENAATTAYAANFLRRVSDWLLTRPEIGAAVSYADAAAEVGCGLDPAYCARGPLPWTDDALRQFVVLYESGAGAGALDDYLDSRRDAALIRALSRTDSSRFIEALFRDLRAQFGAEVPPGMTMLLGGTAATSLALNQRFLQTKVANMAQIIGIATLVSALLFRSLLMGLLVAIPLIAATVFAFSAMTVIGIPLNVATIFLASLSVGIGADYAIYFGMRLRQFLLQHPDDEVLAVRETFRTAGKAALFVASAVGGGYLGLAANIGFNVHWWLGVLVAAAMLASVSASLTVFPALLLMLRPKSVFSVSSAVRSAP